MILSGTPEIFQHPINLAYRPESGFRSHGISRRYSSSFLKQSAKLQNSCGIPPPSSRIPCLRWHKSANYVLSWQICWQNPPSAVRSSPSASRPVSPIARHSFPYVLWRTRDSVHSLLPPDAPVSAPRRIRISSQLRPCLGADALVSPPRCAEKNRECGA